MKRIISFLLFIACLTLLCLTTLAETADKTELGSLLSENHDPSLYEMQSFQPYQKALNNGLSVYDDQSATKEQIDLAVKELQNAKTELILILDREILLTYVSEIDQFLYQENYIVPEETLRILTETKTEFMNLYQNEDLTYEQISAAYDKFSEATGLMESTTKAERFSPNDAKEDVIVPSKIISEKKGLGQITTVRLTLLGIGCGLILLGAITTILYFKPPKSLQ